MFGYAYWWKGRCGNKMTFKEEYITYFKNYIDNILVGNGVSDIVTSAHDEFYYEKEANADFTLKFLPGQIQSSICQYPAEIFIQIEEQYKDDILTAVNTFIEAVNETIVTLDSKSYKQFYTLPSIISTFQNGATKRIVTASVSMSLFEFKVCGISSISIAGETIGFVATSMAYVAETNATGRLTSHETRSVGETSSRTLAITFVPMKKDSMVGTAKILALLYGTAEDPNTEFSITITTSFLTAAWTASWVLKNATHSQEINGFPTVQATFIRRA